MARKFDKLNQILVVDLESTCWDPAAFPDDVPQGKSEPNDIIEIGHTMIEDDLSVGWSIKNTNSIMVIPTASRISNFCTHLTGIKREDVAMMGREFKTACDTLVQFSSRKTWASWGEYDRRQFERQCQREQVDYPLGRSHLNVKRVFSLIVPMFDNETLGPKREPDMKTAHDFLRSKKLIPDFHGRHHSGADDSRNIAEILACLLNLSRRTLEM